MSQNPYPPTQPEPQQPLPGQQYSPYQQPGPPPQQYYPTYPPQQPAYGMAVPQANPYAPQALAPYGIDPLTGVPYSDKSKLVAGLLQIFWAASASDGSTSATSAWRSPRFWSRGSPSGSEGCGR